MFLCGMNTTDFGIDIVKEIARLQEYGYHFVTLPSSRVEARVLGQSMRRAHCPSSLEQDKPRCGHCPACLVAGQIERLKVI
jgi:hypothetical protein